MILLVPVEPELRTRLRAEEKREQAPALQMELSIEPIIAEDSGESRKTSPTCQQHRNLEVLGLYRKRDGARRLHEHGVLARFRYNDLKEAARAVDAGPIQIQWWEGAWPSSAEAVPQSATGDSRSPEAS